MNNPILSQKVALIFVALVSLGFLSGKGPAQPSRKVACVDPTAPEQLYSNASTVGLELDLLGRVRTQAEEERFKQSALSIYNLLTRNELQYYVDTQSAFSAYGIKGPLFNNFVPASVAQAAQFGSLGFSPSPQLTNLWANILNPQLNLQTLNLSAVGQMAAAPALPLDSPALPGAIQLAPVKAPQMSISSAPAAGIIKF